jgi:thiol-disulfide isomerase/thioredoxin
MARLGILALITALALSACSDGRSADRGSQAAASREATSQSPEATGEADSPSPSPAAEQSGSAGPAGDPLHAVVLVDVRTGEEFTLGDLAAEKPLLLETMAIWCTNCRAQMHNVTAAHALADFHSVSLDVDPGELPQDLADYADREGFDWRFAMADGALMRQLRERFGTAVIVPPGMPKILFRTDGSVEMIGLGELLSPEEIAAAVGG